MEAFIADVTHKHFIVLPWISTLLTYFTLGTLPTSSYYGVTINLQSRENHVAFSTATVVLRILGLRNSYNISPSPLTARE